MLPCKTPLLLKDLFFIHIIRNSVNFRIFRKHFIRTIERIEKPKKNRTFTVRCIFWWEWVDSNHLSRKTTDLQSAPALQLRRTPKTPFSPVFTIWRKFVACHPKPLAKGGAGSGNRTRISSLEGLHTSLCTMPAINSKPWYYT